MLQVPRWSVQAMVELVVPLAITVLVVQNGQGVAVLRAAGHDAPVNAITIACGVWSLLAAGVGAVSTCLTGPTNALLAASGERSRHYTAGIVCGLLAMVFGLLAPLFTRLMLATPAAFVAVLGGLAMLRVLQAAFVTAFGGRSPWARWSPSSSRSPTSRSSTSAPPSGGSSRGSSSRCCSSDRTSPGRQPDPGVNQRSSGALVPAVALSRKWAASSARELTPNLA